MHDAEYAQSRYQKFHRGGSLVLVVASLLVNVFVLFNVEDAGSGVRDLRSHAFMILPLVLIWSPDLLASKAIEVSGWLSARNADVAIRIGGWILLGLLLWGANSHFIR